MSPLLRWTRHDERALHAVVLRRTAPLDELLSAVTHLGDAAVVIPATLALLAVPALRAAGAAAAFALVVSHLLVQLLKRGVSRPRPRLPVGCASLVDAPDRFSFPSGHAAAALSLALGLAHALPAPASAALLAVAALVGFSRCYLGVHYPSDVAAGWLLALGASGLAALLGI